MDPNEERKPTWRDLMFGKSNVTFRRSTITYAAVIMLISGVCLVIKGISGTGTIDVKMALVEGKLQSGSIGLLFSFIAFLLLIPCFLRYETTELEVERAPDGTLKIKQKGAFTKEKAKAIRELYSSEKEKQPPIKTDVGGGQ